MSTPAELLQELRLRRPLVHQVTNYVVMNETANITLAAGALPVMAHAIEEVEEMAAAAGALVLNIGTLSPAWVEAMARAGRSANAAGVPVVLDPVGVGATRYRTESARRLLEQVRVTAVRGNAAEVATLIGRSAAISGVESRQSGPTAELAHAAAGRLGSVVAVTGPVDQVSDGDAVVTIANGHALMATVTGTGCMSSALTGCFLAVAEVALDGAVAALVAFGIAGEQAATRARGPGSFHVELYDALYNLDARSVDERARVTRS